MNFKRILWFLLVFGVLLSAVSCGEIVEEEEEETDVTETDVLIEEMIADIDINLSRLANSVTKPTHEKMCVNTLPSAFQEIISYGEDALPYLLEIADAHTEYYGVDDKAYLRCVLACYAAYRIKPSLYQCNLPSPDGKYILELNPVMFITMGDPHIGMMYQIRFLKADTGEELVSTGKISSSAVLTWSDNNRFAIFCDRQHDWNTNSTVTVYDTERNRIFLVNTPYMLEYYSYNLGKTCSVLDLRYQRIHNGDLMFWFGMKADDGTVITGEIAASFSKNVLHEYTIQKNDINDFIDAIPAHKGDGEPEEHYWYNGEVVWTVTKDSEGYFTMVSDGTLGYMINQQKEGEA